VIRSFRCRDTRALFEGKVVRRFGSFARTAFCEPAFRKLAILDAAGCLNDLQIPPGNRLEPLRGDRHGQHSIRINDQFRLCFVWTEAGPEEVEIVDYH
jgi:proteic killer suppression protein